MSVRQLRAAQETSPVEEIVARLADLAPLFRTSANEAERLARLPVQVVRALSRHGLFRLWVPKKCAGFELDLREALEVFEACARLDGSTGWSVMAASVGGVYATYLDAPTANTLFARPESVVATVSAPEGRAVRIAGGYRVTGCWRHATGAHYATSFIVNGIVMEGGQLAFGQDGRPQVRSLVLDANQVAILPVWETTGLRGTGSDDFEVRDVLVPESRSFSVTRSASRESGPLYRLPPAAMTELSTVSVALGIARHALEEFATLARGEKIPGAVAPLAHTAAGQSKFAEASAVLRLARSGVHALAREAWSAALANRALTPIELSEITATCATAVALLRDVVAELTAMLGYVGLQPDNDFARAWRDLQAVAAHPSLSLIHLATNGAALLSA